MLQNARTWWRRKQLARRLSAARRKGHGRFDRRWELASESAGDEVLAWCRDTLSHCRRPWGISHFDLTLDVSTASGPARRLRLSRIEPTDLWCDSDVSTRIAALFPRPCGAAGSTRVTASLLSWGEAVHRAAG